MERERELFREEFIEPQDGFNHPAVSFLLEEYARIVMATMEHEKFHLIIISAKHKHCKAPI